VIELKLVVDPHDGDVAALVALLERTLADPNTTLGADRMREFLAEPRDGARRFYVLVARRGSSVVGGSVFSYVRASNCGFSEYIVAAAGERGTGLGRQLFDARKASLDAQARQHGQAQCNGLFIEVDSPDRTPHELLEAERITALDARERLRIFAHLGFLRVDAPYIQPPLAAGKQPVTYLDLLFAPWPARDRIPAHWVVETLAPIWNAWSSTSAAANVAQLRAELSAADVALIPLF
jgi:hypothetical protein